VGALAYVQSRLPFLPDTTRREALLLACRRSREAFMRRRLREAVAPLIEPAHGDRWRAKPVGLKRYYRDFGGIQTPELTNTLPLKAPGDHGENGVLYSSFEYNWVRLARHYDARRILDRFYLVGQSSGSPLDFGAFAYLAGLSDDPIFVGVSNLADMEPARLMAPVVEPVDILASDWVDPDAFTPRPAGEREIDVVMVANWMRFKRHWMLFDALRHMRHDLRVVLIGRKGEGRTEQTIRDEARAFGVRQELELHTNIANDQVRRHLCNARVSLIMSYREGSCVAVTESFFADTPVGMASDAHVGSKAYLNDETGVLLPRRNLARALSAFIERRATYRPRAWAMSHITCRQTSDKLNTLLRNHALHTGRPWTRDIVPMCWRYNPAYLRDEDEEQMRSAAEALHRDHGLVLARYAPRARASELVVGQGS
jgi:glycosyltransferase involved in cell wall biosynthesis